MTIKFRDIWCYIEKWGSIEHVNVLNGQYTMPCPAHVAIPVYFEMYNKMHMFNQPDVASFGYAIRMSGDLTGGVSGYASHCDQCGQCVDKWPRQIPVPDDLSQVVSDLEGEDLAESAWQRPEDHGQEIN